MSQDWQILLELMALEKIDKNIYRGNNHQTRNNRLFGGQVLAQSMRAAQETVSPERTVHSQHAYFLCVPVIPHCPLFFMLIIFVTANHLQQDAWWLRRMAERSLIHLCLSKSRNWIEPSG